MIDLKVGATLAAVGGRYRSVSIIAANALCAVVLLVCAGIVVGSPTGLPPDEQHLLLAAVFVTVLPVAALLASVTRLSSSVRDRRLAALRILGVSAGRTRRIAAVESACLAITGTLLGIVLYAGLVHPATSLLDTGWGRWLRGSGWLPGWLASVVVLLGVPLLSVGVSLIPAHVVARQPLSVQRQMSTATPSFWRAAPFVVGVGLLAWSVTQTPTVPVATAPVTATFAGAALAALGLPLATPVGIRWMADALARRGRRPALLVAGRRLQQEPTTTVRLVAGLLVALFLATSLRAVLVNWETSPQYMRAVHAATDGPRAVDIVVPPGKNIDVATLRASPEVRSLAPVRTVGIKCDPSAPRNAVPGSAAACGTAVVATCRQLRTLSPGATGCVQGQPAWLIFNPPRLIQATERVTLTDSTESSRQQLVLQVNTRLPVRSDPQDPNWSDTPYDLVIPPDTPGVQALLHQQESVWRVVLDGGEAPLKHLRAEANQHGAELVTLDDINALTTIDQYRSGLYLLTGLVLILGLVALLITSVDRAVERRRHVAQLSVVGVPATVIRDSQWIQVLSPLAVGLPAAAGAGLLAGTAYLNLVGQRHDTPWSATIWITVAALVASLLVATTATWGLGRHIDPTDLRQE